MSAISYTSETLSLNDNIRLTPYRGGNRTSLQIFLVVSTCFLYLVAAGLFSKGVWSLEQDAWVKLAGEGAAEAGAGPGSYDIRKSVWHVNVSALGIYQPYLC